MITGEAENVLLNDILDDNPEVEEAIAELIRRVARMPASDLFLTAEADTVVISVRYLGILKRLGTVSPELGHHFINSIKAMAGMDVAQRRRPLDGRWICELETHKNLDLRISTIPSLYGESMAIRLLDRDIGFRELHDLGLHGQDYDELTRLLAYPSGLILITGPMGSGKTTTAYACIHHVNDGTRKIHTIEDPIEYSFEGICQSQINPKMHLDFPELLRGVLRQAPDVIQVGEIRDPVTAQTTVRAANSGSLVFATLHAPTAAAAVDSMLALGVHPHFLATSLLGVVAQRLVRTLCNDCKVAIDIPGLFSSFDLPKPWFTMDGEAHLYSSSGCDNCHLEGYASRTGVFEVLRVTRNIRQMILAECSVTEIHSKAVEEGMRELRASAMLKVAEGVTSMEEIVRMIPGDEMLSRR